ncbi:hypothetical protein EDD73_11195 [Heliophilum fasciatum]|uniref:Uncharacterized protein n=1 Tax=Heliophilum fasciatum TaxID=35700 RepID=A0A4R2RMJ3_9FIRM|nr:Cys-tRNA synthase (O-phospho-L-seryl-tRNA:Cys-tRNA synthase) [Heliophilum fasciatum]TCP64234.1 hypothetical protein EDD73_11195 [Heliophilum fasciatum]
MGTRELIGCVLMFTAVIVTQMKSQPAVLERENQREDQ